MWAVGAASGSIWSGPLMLDGMRAAPDQATIERAAPSPDALDRIALRWKPPRRNLVED